MTPDLYDLALSQYSKQPSISTCLALVRPICIYYGMEILFNEDTHKKKQHTHKFSVYAVGLWIISYLINTMLSIGEV